MGRGAGIDDLEALYRERYRHFLRVAGLITGERERGHDAVREGFAAAIRWRRDGEDVLARAGHGSVGRSNRKRLLVLLTAIAALAAALLVVAPALGLRADLFGDEPTPSWTWPEGVPGEPIEAPAIVRDANEQLGGRLRRDRVDLDTVREVVSAGEGSAEGAFLAARGLNGDVCLAKVGGGGNFGIPFECLHAPPRPGVASNDERAVFIAASSGGPGASSTTRR